METNQLYNMEQKLFKKTLSKTITAIAILAVGLSSCKKNIENQVVGNVKTFSTKQEAKAYVNQKLNEYGKIIAKLAVNPEMKKLVNNRVAEKFDGDYNVLLKDLVENNSSDRLALKSNLQMSTAPMPSGPAQQVDLQALEIALTEPVVVNGETLYPQIYIPFFEEQEYPEEPIEPGDPGTPLPPDPCLNAVINPLEPIYLNPVIVISDGEEIPGQDTFTGYTYDQNGALIENIPVDECFSKRHRVWGITFNERVGSNGTVPPTTNGPTPTAPTTPIGADAYFPTMTIKEHKESFIKGGSEVYFIAAVSWSNGINPTTNQPEASFRYNKSPRHYGIFNEVNDVDYNFEIKEFTRKEVNRQKSIDVNFNYFRFNSELFSDFDQCKNILFADPVGNYAAYLACKSTSPNIQTHYYPERGDYVYFIIYEYDTGFLDLNGSKIVNVAADNNSIQIRYRSNENPYLATRLKISNKNEQNTGGAFTSNANYDNNEIRLSSRIR
ncbi:hypothetical protein ASE92_17750 [Pedobacter sp. Leaf41]|uniref:hypothetical protein n=1 Tax=Pedobacter sp. Leaf41 TaxID=1736218 RepID=UPI0007036BEB|nr:hypothetical protein [Pedobacter sp. Leaf41]KQN32449.1 hypothetical protein ASE92_17750 [Pedobacter sp. Leaf41]